MKHELTQTPKRDSHYLRLPLAAVIASLLMVGCGGGSSSGSGDDALGNGGDDDIQNGDDGGSAVDPVPRYAYLLHESEPSISWYRFDVDREAAEFAGYIDLAEHDAEEADSIVITPDGRFIYVSDPAGSQVHILQADLASGRLTHAGVEDFGDVTTVPGAMAMSPDGDALYIAREQASPGDNIRAFSIDEADGTLARGTTPNPAILEDLPTTLAVSPDGDYLFGADIASSKLKVFAIDGTGAVERLEEHTVQLEDTNPWDLAVDPDGQRLYVATAGSADERLFAFGVGADGGLEELDAVSPNNFGRVSVSQDGQAIHASPPGLGDTFTYTFNEDDGELEWVDSVTGPSGTSLADVAFTSHDPTGRYLLAVASGPTVGDAVFLDRVADSAPEDYGPLAFGSMAREDAVDVAWATGDPVEVRAAHLYAGDASEDSDVIERFVVDADGRLIDGVTDDTGWEGVSALALVPGLDVLFSTRDQGDGSVWSLELAAEDGTVVDSGFESRELQANDMVVDPGGRFIYVADRAEDSTVAGRITVFEYLPDFGTVGFVGSSSITAEPRDLAMDPSGRYLYAARDDYEIQMFELDGQGGFSSQGTVAGPSGGSSLRQLAVTPDGAFLVAGATLRVATYEIDPRNGILTQIDVGDAGENAESMVSIHPNGERVYTALSLGGSPRLAKFALDPADGTLEFLDYRAYEGLNSLGSGTLAVRPEGDMLYASFAGGNAAVVNAFPVTGEGDDLPAEDSLEAFDTVDRPVNTVIRPVFE